MAKTATATKTEHLAAVVGEDPEADERAALNAEVITLEWKGHEFTLPKRRGRWPTRAAREFGRDNHLEAIVILLGDEAWEQLLELCPVVDDINEFATYAGNKIAAEVVP